MQKGKDGYYHKYFTYEGKRHHVAAKTEPELYMAVGKRMQQLKEGTLIINKHTTVKAWAAEWLATYKDGNMTDKSLDTYRQKLDGYILPAIGGLQLKDVTEPMLQKILNRERGKSYSHVSKLRMVMAQMFGRAAHSRIIPYNPAADLILPECKKTSHRSITEQERAAILAVCDKHHGGLWIKMMLYCGLRPGETMALQWRDIDFKRAVVHIHAAKESGSKKIKAPKTAAGVRDVPIRPDYLAELSAARRDHFKPVFHQHNTANWNKELTDSSMRAMWRSFKRLVDIEMAETQIRRIAAQQDPKRAKLMAEQLSAEIPAAEILRRIKAGNIKATHKGKAIIHGEDPAFFSELVPYCLRHTYCTDLQRAGVALNVAKYLMGHSDIAMTANIYTHTTADVIDDAADKIKALAGL